MGGRNGNAAANRCEGLMTTERPMGDEALHLVEKQAKEMAQAEDKCERGYAHLGWLILEVAQMQYWKLHYSTFRDYLKNLALISHKTPEQLQRYFLTVRDLSDTFK